MTKIFMDAINEGRMGYSRRPMMAIKHFVG
jgi:hypothetical protein